MGKPALDGVRITDFTWAWAGPYGTLLLAFLGAEVIKIESMKRPDHSRMRSLAGGPTVGGVDAAFPYNMINLNKLSVTLNLSQPKAVEIVKKLVGLSDAVVENFRPGVMERLGLDYSALREVKPDIVMVSSSALGETGPERKYVGYAPNFSALSGLAYLTGYPDAPPSTLAGSIDLRSATTLAFATLAALCYRARTGQGQHVDLSSREAISSLIGEIFMDYTMNGRVQFRQGNRDAAMAPHNCYRCKGEDKWVSIAVGTEDEWRRLCEAIGNPDWTADEKFSDSFSRLAHQEELDERIEQWTSNYTHYEVMHILQGADIAATPSLDNEELFNDPHLKERQFAVEVEHPVMGRPTVINAPWKLSGTPAEVRRHSPLMGEHNEYVFGELLGMSGEEIAALKEEQVIY